MTFQELKAKILQGGTVPLTASEWEELAHRFPVVERHPTQLAGDLLIVGLDDALVAVESPSRDARVARLLGGEDQARAFVARRMEEYERMWDGCGVKVNYYDAEEGDRG